jgi:CARDB
MNGFATSLIAVAALTIAVPVPRARPEIRDAEFALATAGLRPFTPETGNRSLEDFWRLVHPLKPDLVITRVVFEPAQPKLGESLAATIYYKNIGGKPAADFYLRLEPGTLNTGGFGLGGGRLAPGEEKPYSWGGIRATTAGRHTLTFSIDPHGAVDESNRRNNQFIVQIEIAGMN